ncbi:endonuclease Q family protein [Paenibacillus pinistramenti]|uniref:endonuclease Q family protein n=1 Tax=Paenibacillus pinistramenti TaxID=1768003 RepID=UPI00110880EB|nr:endonuclease Q family protein [Paenibacillus pinistramenti]
MTDNLTPYYADMHIHIGRTGGGQPVKISGSRDLTFAGIAREAAERKGIQLVGIIDCHVPGVQEDIRAALSSGEMEELAGGGIRYKETTILLGSEIEIREPGQGAAHVLVFLPSLEEMQSFTAWLSHRMKNITLSTQRLHAPARSLQEEVLRQGGLLIPAHIFTPHKSIYGSAADRMSEVLDLSLIDAAELGLSADSEMAGWISELDRLTFLTNSDAHSLGKIGREYNQLLMREPTFEEFRRVIRREDGRQVLANYGLNPRLGKYHRTFCGNCGEIVDEPENTISRCPYCGSHKIVRGVLDRIRSVADREQPYIPEHRPPYHYQVPLEFIPGLGRRKLDALIAAFGHEMNILHRVPEEELAKVAGSAPARMIAEARSGLIRLKSGGGGTYGKVITTD